MPIKTDIQHTHDVSLGLNERRRSAETRCLMDINQIKNGDNKAEEELKGATGRMERRYSKGLSNMSF